VHAVRKRSDSFWSDRNFSCFGSSWNTLKSDDISIFQRSTKRFEITFVFFSGGKNLNFFVILVKIDKDKFRSRCSNTHNSSGNSARFFFQKLAIFNFLSLVLFSELWNSHISVKLVRIRVSTCISLGLDPLSSILSILGWVEFFLLDNFLFLWCFTTLSFLSFFLSFLLLSFFGCSCLLLSLCLSLFQFTLRNPLIGNCIKEFLFAISGVS